MEANLVLPVTILTGFLGSGKTTLLKYLLEHNDTEKIAIVENEFGEVSIDSELLKTEKPLELIELKNGCICCNVRGDLTEALHELLTRIDRGEIEIDYLVLETTGLADPAPIIQTFFIDELIRDRVRLDAVITLVDAEHALKQLDEHRVAASQIGFADRIILTKADRVSEKVKNKLLDRIHAINMKADIVEVSFGLLPKHEWLGINAFELNDSLQVTQGSKKYIFTKNHPEMMEFLPFTQKDIKSYDDTISSYLFESLELDIDKIGKFMENAIELYGNDMLRYKGILAIRGEEQKLIVQGVHKVIGFDYGDSWADEERKSVLIMIGRDLPIEKLRKEFLAAAI